ncbi:DUF4440 domain-containing protein [Demequina sp. NBRC 110053]|uniref:DUF4440 domain-containing protein n=1 Tax=Demequina sp. NBRC 110053 TaxID=1570342 RepID=UPI0009FE1367|nr:DUF4440 domain-containing protein [Demequina sp. NBRC 110053]
MEHLPDTLESLFDAERRRDWKRLRMLLHPDVIWTVIDREESRVVGAQAYIDRLMAAYRDGGASDFVVSHVRRGSEGLVATELIDEEGRISVDVFKIDESGVLVQEWEHLLGRASG